MAHKIVTYLISDGLDTLGRFSLLPWTLMLLRQSLTGHNPSNFAHWTRFASSSNRNSLALQSSTSNMHLISEMGAIGAVAAEASEHSWSQVISAYGLLYSVMELGRLCGREMVGESSTFLSISPLHVSSPTFTNILVGTLSCGYVGLTMTSRYSLLLLIFFIIGFCGSSLSESSKLVRVSLTSSLAAAGSVAHRPQALGSHSFHSLSNTPSQRPSDEDCIYRTLWSFIFSTLISGMLYDSFELSQFPARWPCCVMSSLCSFVWTVRFFRELKRQRKRGSLPKPKNVSHAHTQGICSRILQSLTAVIFFLFSLLGGVFSLLHSLASSVNRWALSATNVGGSTKAKVDDLSTLSARSSSSLSSSSSSSSSSAFRQRGTDSLHEPRDVGLESGVQQSIHQGEIPANFLGGDASSNSAAYESYTKALQWRAEHDLDHFLDGKCPLPYKHFEDILMYYPHAIHGYSKDGCAVVYEILGKAQPKELKLRGITPEHLAWHFTLRNEVALSLDPPASSRSHPQYAPYSRLMTVLDVEGVRVVDITADVIAFIKQSSEIMDTYYPRKVARLVICNSPPFFYTVWSMIARVLPDSVRAKINILNSLKDLDQYIDPSERPVKYGGTDISLGQRPEHLSFLRCHELYKEHSLPTATHGSASASSLTSKLEAMETEETMKKGSESETEGGKDGGREDTDGGGGMMGWMTSRLKPQPPQAFLGRKNAYRYDESNKVWVLGGGSEDEMEGWIDTGRDGGKSGEWEEVDREDWKGEENKNELTRDQLEEHGLVLAIQAAHLAMMREEGGAKAHSLGPNHSSSLLSSSAIDTLESGGSHASSSLYSSSSVTSATSTAYPNTLPPSLPLTLLVCGLMYVLSSFINSCVIVLLPVWMATQPSHGGLGYSVNDISVVLSCGGVALLFIYTFTRMRLENALGLSPVRSIRIACGTIVVITLLTSFFVTSTPSLLPSIMSSFPTSLPPTRPSQSLLLTIVPAVLFATLIGATLYGRNAAESLLMVALSPSFPQPYPIVRVVGSFCDLLSPVTLTLIYSSLYQHRLRFPLDSTCFLSLSCCASAFLYLGSLLLNVHYRGDFGIISDPSLQPYNHSYSDGSASNATSERRDIYPPHSQSPRTPSLFADVMAVPLGDIALLMGKDQRYDSFDLRRMGGGNRGKGKGL